MNPPTALSALEGVAELAGVEWDQVGGADLLETAVALGRVALAKRDYAGATRHLDAALAQDQLASGIHYPLAMAYRGLGAMGRGSR